MARVTPARAVEQTTAQAMFVVAEAPMTAQVIPVRVAEPTMARIITIRPVVK
ncbi:hypothetical protein NBRC116584_22040 [Hydrogenophaga sp. 5NK40-0174]